MEKESHSNHASICLLPHHQKRKEKVEIKNRPIKNQIKKKRESERERKRGRKKNSMKTYMKMQSKITYNARIKVKISKE